MDSATQTVSTLIIALALVLTIVGTQIARRRKARNARVGQAGSIFPLRPIAAYETIPQIVGGAIESDRPVHLSFGSAGVGGVTTVLALAAADAFYQIARRTVTGSVTPLITLSDPTALMLGYGSLQRAFRERDRLARLKRGNVHWYPAGGRSLAFAAALTGAASNARASGDILIGSFGMELALILDGSRRRRAASIAASDQLEGQAIAWVMATHPLIGEEVFLASAYLGDRSSDAGALLALDTLRWLIIIGLIAAAALLLRDALGVGI
ncbi:hypothetical protein FBR02_08425 [Anaerolineae bacterium CFX9]|nr:hypothetical protein [Anaerolineae bacterium CFX9]